MLQEAKKNIFKKLLKIKRDSWSLPNKNDFREIINFRRTVVAAKNDGLDVRDNGMRVIATNL